VPFSITKGVFQGLLNQIIEIVANLWKSSLVILPKKKMPAGMIYAQAWIIQKRAYVLSGKLFYASTIPVGGFCCRSKRLGRLERAHPAVLLKFSFVLFHPLIVPSKQKALNDARN
jgi:hypothetical protein